MAIFDGGSTTNFESPQTGNFSPTIFAQKVLMFFRTASIVEGITNNDYFGEISGYGDTVRIIKEPKLNVFAYTRGLTVDAQALDDDEQTLEISEANYFSFEVDDIEEKLSHINWQSLAQGSATYALKNAYDKEVLLYMSDKAQAANIVSFDNTALTHTTAQLTANIILADFSGDAGSVDPLNILSLLALKLDEADIPEEGRWCVVSPRFMELLAKTASTLMSSDFNQGEGGLKNGLVMHGKLRGFSLYKTNNAVKFTGETSEDGDILMAGHMTSTATASAIDKAEVIRSERSFADIVRGLHVYGRSVLYAEALAVAYIKYV